MNILVENSPFSKEQSELLNRLLPTLTSMQKIWLSGYLSVGQVDLGSIPLEISNIADNRSETIYSRENPYQAEILESIRLNGRGSNKNNLHVELSIEGSGFTYEPGDKLGIYDENDPELIKKLEPHYYPISSSYIANPEEIHITISTSHNNLNLFKPGNQLSIFVENSNAFSLPQNKNVPIIMIGTGSGIAPFRSFMQENEEREAEGKSWLFFSDQHFVTDFLYQVEWQKLIKTGSLTRLDVAFSDDGEKKVYIQDRLHEHRKELFKWIQDGAYVYICCDENEVVKDVHKALFGILQNEGDMNQEETESYLSNLQQQNRYQVDVIE